jgi:oxygen-independent coproporphyrinogen-3 oxidase
MEARENPKAGLAVYIHVPFCLARCTYCDFNSYTGLESRMGKYVDALCQEIYAAGRRLGLSPVETVYFGGGTPSLLPLERLEDLMTSLQGTFGLLPGVEVTLEANPGTVARARLEGLRRIGVNRLSLGVQSVHQDELDLLGRLHTWPQAVDAFALAREVGFESLNVDLIFGLPGQSLASWRKTLEEVLQLDPTHLSLYGLSLEHGTPLAERVLRGEVPAPSDDTAACMYELAERLLAQAGFFHYEISNWAALNRQRGVMRRSARRRSGPWWPEGSDLMLVSEDFSRFVCRHNLAYWRNQPWLGLGAGAHSWLSKTRSANLRHPDAYVRALARGEMPVAEREEIDLRLEMGETMMMGIRLAEGARDVQFRARFGIGLAEAFGDQLAGLVTIGLITWDGQAARLTARGRLLGNHVFAEFL